MMSDLLIRNQKRLGVACATNTGEAASGFRNHLKLKGNAKLLIFDLVTLSS